MDRHPLLPPDFEDFWTHETARMRRHRRVTLAIVASAWILCAIIVAIGLLIAVPWLIDVYLSADAATIMMF